MAKELTAEGRKDTARTVARVLLKLQKKAMVKNA